MKIGGFADVHVLDSRDHCHSVVEDDTNIFYNELSFYAGYCGAFATLFPRNDKCPANTQGGRDGWAGTLNKLCYYSFKIFPHFLLVKTTCIIYCNQLLLTEFGKNLRVIESMTSKMEPSKNYSTIDVKMTSKVQPALDY